MSFQGRLGTAVFSDLPAGKYILEVRTEDPKSGVLRRYLPVYVGESAAENDDLKVSDDHFMRFTTHGRVYLPEETDRLRSDLHAFFAEPPSITNGTPYSTLRSF